MNKANATNNANVENNATEWCVSHYTPSMEQQKIMCMKILSKISTKLRYVERPLFGKELNTRNFWIFELGTQEGINVPIWIIVGFQQRDRQDS